MQIDKTSLARCLQGAFAADIASMGTHWIYDPKEMAKSVPSLQAPEFKTPPTPNFYSSKDFPGHYGAGMLSPYGEQLLHVVEVLATYGSATNLEGPVLLAEMVKWASEFGGRLDHATTTIVENVQKKNLSYPEAGADDNQAHCFLKAIPITVYLLMASGTSASTKPPAALAKQVEAIVRVHQNNDEAVAFGIASAQILWTSLTQGSVPSTGFTTDKPDAQKAWQRGVESTSTLTLEELLLEMSHEAMVGKEDNSFYDLAARACAVPPAFVVPCYLTQSTFKGATSETSAYVRGVRANILGAGDTCSRAILIGAILAAVEDAAPPADWIAKIDQPTWERITTAIDKLLEKAAAEAPALDKEL